MGDRRTENLFCYDPSKVNSYGMWNNNNPLEYSLPLVCLQLIIIFLISNLIFFILRPFKQPRIVSQILGGIILGPSVLCRSETFKNVVFPERGKQLLDTIAFFGLMYHLFIIGLKTDPKLLINPGRKAFVIGISSVLLSFCMNVALCFLLRHHLTKILNNVVLLGYLCSVLAITAFPNTVQSLTEINLLNSELARMATSASVIGDVTGWTLMFSFIVIQAGQQSHIRMLWATLTLLGILGFIWGVVRPVTQWIIRRTPEGKEIPNVYVFFILICVSAVGFFSDMIGANSFNGALILGLAIPDGPPLGSAIVEKTEFVVTTVFLPFFFAMTGLKANIYTIRDVRNWGLLQLIVVTGLVGKVIGSMLPSLYYKLPFRDALSVSVIIQVKGLIEIVTFNYWWDLKMLDDESLTILMLNVIAITAISTPLFTALYQPSNRYVAQRRRTVLHSRPDDEMRILTCIQTPANVPTIINLMEATHPTEAAPLVLFTVHLIELVGRINPIFISHKLARTSSSVSSGKGGTTQTDPIINAFRIFQQRHGEAVSIYPFTSVAPYRSVHDEICQLAHKESVVMVILPYHKKPMLDGSMQPHAGYFAMNQNILATAPCSVGILVDHTQGNSMCTLSGNFTHHIAILFFGGDDDREALAYVSRMSSHPGVLITAVRFLSCESIKDRSREHKMDNELFNDFTIRNVGNERTVHREVVVKDMEQILTVIRALDIDRFDLFVVGMRHSTTAMLSKGIAEWSYTQDLGVMGDLLASPDFGYRTAVLVVRTQINVRLRVPGQLNSSSMPQEEGLAGAGSSHSSTHRPRIPPRMPSRMHGEGASVRFRNAQQSMPDQLERNLLSETSINGGYNREIFL